MFFMDRYPGHRFPLHRGYNGRNPGKVQELASLNAGSGFISPAGIMNSKHAQ